MTIVDRRYSVAEGTAVKAPCRVATTANIALSGLQTIDGITLVADDRVLVKNQSTGSENGIYSASSGNWTRTRDFDGSYDIVSGTRVFVTLGTANAGSEFYVSTTGAITVGTTSITISQMPAGLIASYVSAAAASATAASGSATAASGSASSASSSASAAAASAVTAAASALGFAPPASFKNLSIKTTSTTTFAVVADFITVTNGSSYLTLAFSATCDMAVNGAANRLDTGSIASGTWYAVWAIAKSDGTTGVLASTSATSPTMPTGYTYKARIGWTRTVGGSATLHGIYQYGNRAQYVVGAASTTLLPSIINQTSNIGSVTVPTYVSSSVASYVPTTASVIHLAIGVVSSGGSAAATLLVAPNGNYGAYNSTTNMPPITSVTDITSNQALVHGFVASLLLETANIFVAFVNGGNVAISTLGWEDNL